MKKTLLAFAACTIAVTTIFSSCKKDDEGTTTTMTLYDTLGGTQMVADPVNSGQMIEKGRLGIRSVVDSTIFVIAADPQLNSKFFGVLLSEVGGTPANTTGLTALEKSLTDFFCVATGAKNFTYSGKNMSDAHNPAKNGRMGAKANSAEFDRFVADLVIGAKKVGLSDQIIGRVGAIVETTRSQVVQN